MVAIVNTKSNFKNVNGKPLQVIELLKSQISCKIPSEGFSDNGEPLGNLITADFNVEKELISLW